MSILKKSSNDNYTSMKNYTTVKPVLSGHSKRRPKLVFKTSYYLMQVKSIAKCSNGSILQYFTPSLSENLSLRPLFCLFLSGSLIKKGFTVFSHYSKMQTLSRHQTRTVSYRLLHWHPSLLYQHTHVEQSLCYFSLQHIPCHCTREATNKNISNSAC